MIKHNSLNRYILLALLISIASVLAYLDSILSRAVISLIPIIGTFNIKIGFANIIILYIISRYKFIDSLIGVILKSIIIGFIYANLQTFLIGFTGTMLSYICMYLLKPFLKRNNWSIVVSIVGGITHMFGQIVIVCLIYGLNNITLINQVLIYSPIMLLVGAITGAITGVIYDKLIKQINLIEEKA